MRGAEMGSLSQRFLLDKNLQDMQNYNPISSGVGSEFASAHFRTDMYMSLSVCIIGWSFGSFWTKQSVQCTDQNFVEYKQQKVEVDI